MSDLPNTENTLKKVQSYLSSRPNIPPYMEVALQTAKQESEQQDIDDIIDKVMGNDKQPDLPQVKETVSIELWETLAYDLALDTISNADIAVAYGITLDSLNELLTNQHFVKMLKNKQDEIKNLGTDAAFAIKMRMIANKATPDLLKRLKSDETSAKDFLNMFKTVVEYGQLAPREQDNETPMPVMGTQVVINLGGVPGLEHLGGTQTVQQVTQHNVIEHDDYIDDEVEELD